jgi:hypothetical protein
MSLATIRSMRASAMLVGTQSSSMRNFWRRHGGGGASSALRMKSFPAVRAQALENNADASFATAWGVTAGMTGGHSLFVVSG